MNSGSRTPRADASSRLTLAKLEDQLRSEGPSEVPPGLADRVARLALASPQSTPFEWWPELLPLAWRGALVSVAMAIGLFLIAPSVPDSLAELDDPIAELTTLPLDLIDPSLALSGDLE